MTENKKYELNPETLPKGLSEFVIAYLEAAFWCAPEPDECPGCDDLSDMAICDMNIRSLKDVVKDCEDFQDKNKVNLSHLIGAEHKQRPPFGLDIYDESMAGYHFWMDRNGTGIGYTDSKFIKSKARKAAIYLSDICRDMGEKDIVIGHDGKVHIE